MGVEWGRAPERHGRRVGAASASSGRRDGTGRRERGGAGGGRGTAADGAATGRRRRRWPREVSLSRGGWSGLSLLDPIDEPPRQGINCWENTSTVRSAESKPRKKRGRGGSTSTLSLVLSRRCSAPHRSLRLKRPAWRHCDAFFGRDRRGDERSEWARPRSTPPSSTPPSSGRRGHRGRHGQSWTSDVRSILGVTA